MEKFFLREKDNLPIIFMGIALLVFDAFVIMQGFMGWESALGRLGIPSGIFLLPIFVMSNAERIRRLTLLPRRAEFSIFDEDKNNFLQNTKYIIRRDKAVARIRASIYELMYTEQENFLKCVLLTGESGSGKSYLLENFLKPALTAYSVYYFKAKDQCNDFIEGKINIESGIVIFDQFEYYYENETFLTRVNSLKSKNIVVVFAFQEKDMAKIFKRLEEKLEIVDIEGNLYCRLLFLETSQDDIDELRDRSATLLEKILDPKSNLNKAAILEKMTNFSINSDEEEYCKIRILCALLAEIEDKRKPLVSFYAVTQIMENDYFNRDSILSEILADSPDDLVNLYLETWTNQHRNVENANALLYLLCSMQKYSKEDFERLLFERNDNGSSSGSHDDYFMSLGKLFFTTKPNEHPNSLGLTHEYYRVKILDYLESAYADKVNLSEIKGYIDGHGEIFSPYNMSAKANKFFTLRLSNYRAAQEVVRKYCLVLLIGVAMIQIYNFVLFDSGQALSPVHVTQRIGISIAMILSTYYVYNFIKKVFCLFDKWVYRCASFAGILSVWAALLIPEWWGIPIGLNIFVIGFVQYLVIRKHKTSALIEKTAIPIVIGIIIVVLGVYYGLGFAQRDWLGIRFYMVESDIAGLFILFYVYTLACIGLHINQRNMLNKLIMINNALYANSK